MSRPIKTGLDYYPHDTDCSRDPKLRYIEAIHGLNGYAVYHKILEQIYDNGYFIIADKRWMILFAGDNKIEFERLNLIITDCVKESLFEDKIYSKYFVLTSSSIQKRYINACDRRKEISLCKQYLCLSGINEYINSINDNINLVITDISTQSKVKESKVININKEQNAFEFYKLEVDKAKQFNDPMSKDYINYCNHLCLKNQDGSWRLSHVLKIENQISLNEFAKLYEKAGNKLDIILSKVDSLQTNKKYHDKYIDVYLTINKWLSNNK